MRVNSKENNLKLVISKVKPICYTAERNFEFNFFHFEKKITENTH